MDFVTPLLGFLIVNGTGIQVRVNCHLFTGHGIQRKSCRYLGHTFGTFVDHQELNHNQDNEDNGSYNQITAAYKLSERHYHIAGSPRSQNQPGGRYIHGYPENSGEQQNRREVGHIQHFLNKHTGKQNRKGDGNIKCHKHVQYRRRKRHNQHNKRHQYIDRYDRICLGQSFIHVMLLLP